MHAGHYPNSGDLKTDAMHLFYIYLLYERGKRFKYSTSRYSMRMVFAVLLLYFIDEPVDGVRCIALGDGKVVPP